MNQPLKLLMVEDSEDDELLVSRALTKAGYDLTYQRVQTAEALQEALTTETWDIVLSDYSMPHFSGADALKIIQTMGLDLPFIIVSGAIGEERAVEIMKAGAHDYVMKANLARLPPAVARELREAEGRQARKHAEEQVYKLSRALEQSANLIMITDTTGLIEYVNHSFTRVTGYSWDEVIGKHSRLIKSESTPLDLYRQLWSSILQGETWRGEFQNKQKNGALYWVETVISAIRNHAGDITHFLAVQEDISERKRLESELQRYTTQLEKMVEERTVELRQAKDQIELILNNTSDALALAEPNGDIQMVNPAFSAMFEEQATHAIENILMSIATDEQITLVSAALRQAIFDGTSQRIETQIIARDGSHRDVDLAFIPVGISDDSLKNGILLSAHDITHLKEIERFKSRFVADAVHDLATPITGLQTRLYLLKRTPERFEQHMRALENQVEHLRELLEDLRTLSQLDRRQIVLSTTLCNVNQLVHKVFDTYEPVALDKEQTLVLNLDPSLPTIYLDQRQFERALVNLVSNAINYTPAHKTITIQTYLEEQVIVVTVSDQGIGIGTEDLPHVFERFYRTVEARQAHTGGTGLGLTIVKEIIELHGGTVMVNSEPGLGSTFRLQLPCKA